MRLFKALLSLKNIWGYRHHSVPEQCAPVFRQTFRDFFPDIYLEFGCLLSFLCEHLSKKHLHLQVFFCRAVYQQDSSQPVLLHGVVQSQEENFAFVFAEHHGVPIGQFLPLFKYPWITALSYSTLNSSELNTLVSCIKWMKLYSLLLFRSVIKMFDSAISRTDPLRNTTIRYPLGFNPLPTTLCGNGPRSFSQTCSPQLLSWAAKKL